MALQIVHTYTVSDPITLADLRELVAGTTDLDARSRVTVQGPSGDQRDRIPAKITVHGR